MFVGIKSNPKSDSRFVAKHMSRRVDEPSAAEEDQISDNV